MTKETEEILSLREILRRRIEISRGILAAEDVALEGVHAEFRPRIIEVRDAEEAARLDLERAIVAQALADNADMPMHLLYEWKRSGDHWGRRPFTLTGRVGRYEIRSPDSKFIGLPYSIGMGDKFIRVLKKDGTPSLHYYAMRPSLSLWLPDGEIPK